MSGDALWEVQWHPAGGGRPRRLVLTRRGLRRALAAIAVTVGLVLLIVAALPLGLRGFLTSFTVDAAQRDNRALRLKGDELREEEHRIGLAVFERVQRGRRVAWTLGARPGLWQPPCPPVPGRGEGDATTAAWLSEQSARLDSLGDALALAEGGLRRPLSAVPFAFPVEARKAVPTALFGWRVSPFTGKTAAHYGATLAAQRGEAVRAPADGRVLFAGSVRERRANEWTRFGTLVVLDHGGGIATVFAHLGDVAVRRGQSVTRGQRIGTVGQTGWTRVPALYYEVRWPLLDGPTPIDPALVTAGIPVENLDSRLADPTGGLPAGFARIEHLVGARGDRPRPVRSQAPAAAPEELVGDGG